MDEQIRWEAQHFESDVPFRAQGTHRHATWAGTWHSRPELYIQPTSLVEIQKVVNLARRCRRHIVTVGSGHSPSDLTCTSSWKVNLDKFNQVLAMDKEKGIITVEAGIRLFQLQEALRQNGFALSNAGSITEQSIAGAIATATHGSSLRHGLLSNGVLALKIVTADGSIRSCSRDEDQELFRAALVSLGALGIVVEVTYQATPDFKLQWKQSLRDLDWVIQRWDDGLWTETEFVRVWWMPYMKKCIHWQAEKTDLPLQAPGRGGLLDGRIGFHVYQMMLYVANWIPSLTPWIERLVGRIQYGSGSGADGTGETAVQWSREALSMDCLYSQFVNEWAIPLSAGPEALTRLSAWLHGDNATAKLPFSSRGIYVHAPIEVRVSDGRTGTGPRAFLDTTEPEEATLYLNATLYRPYHADPPCTATYYAAFEHLMRELGGRPHWAKNFSRPRPLTDAYPLAHRWLKVRDDVDPQGMFFGAWHRRNLLADEDEDHTSGDVTPKQEERKGVPASLDDLLKPSLKPRMLLEESMWAHGGNAARGGRNYFGQVGAAFSPSSYPGGVSATANTTASNSPPASVGSFELMDHGDAEMSVLMESRYPVPGQASTDGDDVDDDDRVDVLRRPETG